MIFYDLVSCFLSQLFAKYGLSWMGGVEGKQNDGKDENKKNKRKGVVVCEKDFVKHDQNEQRYESSSRNLKSDYSEPVVYICKTKINKDPELKKFEQKARNLQFSEIELFETTLNISHLTTTSSPFTYLRTKFKKTSQNPSTPLYQAQWTTFSAFIDKLRGRYEKNHNHKLRSWKLEMVGISKLYESYFPDFWFQNLIFPAEYAYISETGYVDRRLHRDASPRCIAVIEGLCLVVAFPSSSERGEDSDHENEEESFEITDLNSECFYAYLRRSLKEENWFYKFSPLSSTSTSSSSSSTSSSAVNNHFEITRWGMEVGSRINKMGEEMTTNRIYEEVETMLRSNPQFSNRNNVYYCILQAGQTAYIPPMWNTSTFTLQQSFIIESYADSMVNRISTLTMNHHNRSDKDDNNNGSDDDNNGGDNNGDERWGGGILPESVILQIMSYLEVDELLKVFCVNKTFMRIAFDSSLWRRHLLRLEYFFQRLNISSSPSSSSSQSPLQTSVPRLSPHTIDEDHRSLYNNDNNNNNINVNINNVNNNNVNNVNRKEGGEGGNDFRLMQRYQLNNNVHNDSDDDDDNYDDGYYFHGGRGGEAVLRYDEDDENNDSGFSIPQLRKYRLFCQKMIGREGGRRWKAAFLLHFPSNSIVSNQHKSNEYAKFKFYYMSMARSIAQSLTIPQRAIFGFRIAVELGIFREDEITLTRLYQFISPEMFSILLNVPSLLQIYLSKFNFSNTLITIAFQTFMNTVRVPAEASIISRYVDLFCEKYVIDNPSKPQFDSEFYYIVLFAALLATPNLKTEMTLEEFIRMLSTSPHPLTPEVLDYYHEIYNSLPLRLQPSRLSGYYY